MEYIERYQALMKLLTEEKNIYRIIGAQNQAIKDVLYIRLNEIAEIKTIFKPFELETIYELLKPKTDEKRILQLAKERANERRAKLKKYRENKNQEYEKEKQLRLEREEQEDNKFWKFIIMLLLNREITVLFYRMEPDLFIQTLIAITRPIEEIKPRIERGIL